MKLIPAMVPCPLQLSPLKSDTWLKLSTPRGTVRSVLEVEVRMVLTRRRWREGERENSYRMDMDHFQGNSHCHTHHFSPNPIPMEWFQHSLKTTTIQSPTMATSILANHINKPHPLTPPTTITVRPSLNLRPTDPSIPHKIPWRLWEGPQSPLRSFPFSLLHSQQPPPHPITHIHH